MLSRTVCRRLSETFGRLAGSAFTAPSGFRGAPLADHRARDHDPLDLLRPFVDLRDLGVAHHPLDGVFGRVAVTAEQLAGVAGDAHRTAAALGLPHRAPR